MRIWVSSSFQGPYLLSNPRMSLLYQSQQSASLWPVKCFDISFQFWPFLVNSHSFSSSYTNQGRRNYFGTWSGSMLNNLIMSSSAIPFSMHSWMKIKVKISSISGSSICLQAQRSIHIAHERHLICFLKNFLLISLMTSINEWSTGAFSYFFDILSSSKIKCHCLILLLY